MGPGTSQSKHIAPSFGLLVHCIETDRDIRRSDGSVVGRASFDILGTVPVGVVETTVEVLRGGWTTELRKRPCATTAGPSSSRAWLMHFRDTAALAGSPLPAIPGSRRDAVVGSTTVWPGGYIASAEVRRLTWGRAGVVLGADRSRCSRANR